MMTNYRPYSHYEACSTCPCLIFCSVDSSTVYSISTSRLLYSLLVGHRHFPFYQNMAGRDSKDGLCGQSGVFKRSKYDIKAVRQQLNRRGRSLFKKALELSILCSVDTYVLIHQHGHFKSFNSDEGKAWLLTPEKLVISPSTTSLGLS